MASIPGIEVADHTHAARVRCPQAEHHTLNAFPLASMGTHPSPNVVMVAFGEQMAVHFAHPFLAKCPRVMLLMGDPTTLNP